MSHVARERQLAARRAAQQAIGRQLNEAYTVSDELPDHLAALMSRLSERGPSDLISATLSRGAAVVATSVKQRSRTASLVQRLRASAAELAKTLEEVREEVRETQQQALIIGV